jgi:hypothetical protein
VTVIPPDAQAIYAVFPIERLPAGTRLEASWTFNGTPLEGFDLDVTAPRDQLQGWLEFHLERTGADPWPDGEYAVSLTSSGVLVANGAVLVLEPAQ